MVFYNDEDINLINTKHLRDKVSVALQTNYFLNATMKENILMGKDEDNIKLNHVLEITGVMELVSELEKGLDTQMDDFNSQFSGGELQRIALARALLKEADVYLFDEIFSNIDNISKQKIYQNITNYLHNKIVLFVTHDSEILNLYRDNIIEIKDETFIKNSSAIKIS
jgi:ABC-type transport system involved in cytochrome bd biosynthesis fused ATPase/permease subunit